MIRVGISMRLSLCLIARNEQHNLPRALASFRGVCHEIIVVDTGSTDQTVAVARELGATVVSFQWCDDFSAARNFCLKHASGDWIFWLDADEELLPESVQLLRSCMSRSDVAGWFVLRQDLSRGDRSDWFTEMWQLRLFRRDQRLRFVGRCHPEFQPSLSEVARETGRAVLPSAIRLRHWGYVAELKLDKLRRSARLLKLELTDRPGSLYYQIEYGRTLMALGERAEGLRVIHQATTQMVQYRNDPLPPTSMAAALLEYLLALPAGDLPSSISRNEVCALCDRWFPGCVPLLWAMSKGQFESGNFERAAALLEKLIQLGRADRYDKSISFDPRIIREDAALNLAACYIRLADLDRAEQVLQPLLSTPRRADAEQNLAAITNLRNLMQVK